MDKQLFDHLGPNRSIISDKLMHSGVFKFRERSFNAISCNKLAVVLDIMGKCDVDIVFSDVDNIFLKDPFQHDIGHLIKMKSYDYIYSPNRRAKDPRSGGCLSDGFSENSEGNTGFYYLSRSSKLMKESMKNAIETCEQPGNSKDDQALFWEEMKSQEYIANQTSKPWFHCNSANGYDSRPNSAAVNNRPPENDEPDVKLCCLDGKKKI